METMDPLKQAEDALKQIHQATHRKFHPMHRKYPVLFLLLATFSIAALFHGLDMAMDEFSVLKEFPFILILAGIFGLLITGGLYKRLGRDKYEE